MAVNHCVLLRFTNRASSCYTTQYILSAVLVHIIYTPSQVVTDHSLLVSFLFFFVCLFVCLFCFVFVFWGFFFCLFFVFFFVERLHAGQPNNLFLLFVSTLFIVQN